MRADVRTFHPATPEAHLVLKLDTGARRLLEWHADNLGLSLAGLFWYVAGQAHGVPLSRLRELQAEHTELAGIAYQLLEERNSIDPAVIARYLLTEREV